MDWIDEDEDMPPERNLSLLLAETAEGTMARRRLLEDRTPSPVPTYESMESDFGSDDDMSDFGEEPLPSLTRIQLERPESPAVSCCSMESDLSDECPVKPFWMGPRQIQKSNRSTRWSPIDKAEVKVLLGITEQSHPAMNLPFISKALNDTLKNLEEDEPIDFKKCLVRLFPQIFENSLLEHAIPDVVDKMLERCDMEASLKITLLVLEEMKQKEKSKFLHRKCLRNEMQYDLKASLKKRYTFFEGLAKQNDSTHFDKIYTELVINEGGKGTVNTEHEVKQIERIVDKKNNVIKCREIFTLEAGFERYHRFLLMKGKAGAGKSACVQRFVLDWANGEGHQDMYFVFPISFNELNSLKSEKYSLIQIIHHFFPEMKRLDNFRSLDDIKVLFIFDGLDECHHPLRFFKNEMWCHITKPTSMDVLLTNLFMGHLFNAAYIWVTSRPSISNRIYAACVYWVVEVRGFNDAQKEDYFKKTVSDQTLANRIITHLQSERSLYIMCHLPSFCWTVSDILQSAFCTPSEEIPKGFTEIFTRFVLIQLNTMKQRRYHQKELTIDEVRELLMKLGKLAFNMLERDIVFLTEEQWEETGICREEAVVYSGFCTELFRERCVLYQDKVYYFIHLYIQEYLAALYVFLSFKNHNRNILEKALSGKFPKLFKTTSLVDVHKSAVDRTLQCPNGSFDMFLRFLLGLSLESNQESLRGIVTKVGGGTRLEKTAQYIRNKMKENYPEERLNCLARCLTEIQPLHSTV